MELLFVLIPLLAIVFGAIEVDRMLLIYTSVANAARAGVRYAAVHGTYNPASDTEVQQVVKVFASAGILDTSQLTVTVAYEDGTDHVGSPVSVSVAYPFQPLSGFVPLSGTLRSTAKATVAF